MAGIYDSVLHISCQECGKGLRAQFVNMASTHDITKSFVERLKCPFCDKWSIVSFLRLSPGDPYEIHIETAMDQSEGEDKTMGTVTEYDSLSGARCPKCKSDISRQAVTLAYKDGKTLPASTTFECSKCGTAIKAHFNWCEPSIYSVAICEVSSNDLTDDLIEEFKRVVYENLDWIDPGGKCSLIDLAYGFYLAKVANIAYANNLARNTAYQAKTWELSNA